MIAGESGESCATWTKSSGAIEAVLAAAKSFPSSTTVNYQAWMALNRIMCTPTRTGGHRVAGTVLNDEAVSHFFHLGGLDVALSLLPRLHSDEIAAMPIVGATGLLAESKQLLSETQRASITKVPYFSRLAAPAPAGVQRKGPRARALSRLSPSQEVAAALCAPALQRSNEIAYSGCRTLQSALPARPSKANLATCARAAAGCALAHSKNAFTVVSGGASNICTFCLQCVLPAEHFCYLSGRLTDSILVPRMLTRSLSLPVSARIIGRCVRTPESPARARSFWTSCCRGGCLGRGPPRRRGEREASLHGPQSCRQHLLVSR